ncbi:ABC transporter substrate-binding protein [Cognatishimia maritima]|uniref:Iron(III) transport system substrate-binding protein n=1 Tax=Cognatishimia maritima TaxID=870908 RepID=A0A1M5VXI6_9RHOB|nr:ABC transporter substrate-binding protein [Cognatishimia maritima]SHH80019.1 iron(III) transport system substrate-binding protein [Cognatishimia maritima]
MRNLIVLALVFLCHAGWAQDWEDQQIFKEAQATATLRIISSTDTDLFAPLIEAFVSRNPDIAIEYLVTGTADLDRRFRRTPDAFDIAISSAMDLQFRLTNDGYALELDGVSHPAWAQWRRSLFAFTSEPAAIVINRAAFDGQPIPQTRQELIEALRARPEVFRGRVGTYDVRQSGLGYLFATQDARASETFWRLMEVMGGLDARLYCCSGDMIDDLTNGTIAVAYNVLGSYAEARAESQDVFEIILPSDFPTTMMRTALVSKETGEPEAAQRFIQFLVTYQFEPTDVTRTLPPLHDRENGTERATIALEPTLMTFLDALKRDKFLTEWENALIQN